MSDLKKEPTITYDLELWCYGWENQKAQIKLRPKIKRTKDIQRKGAYEAINSLPRLSIDVKHSRDWNCEGCGKVARESLFSIASYMHQKPPMIITFVHFLCDAGYGPCLDAFDEMNKERSEAMGHPFVPQRRRSGPGQPLEPMSTTCAGCKDPKTAGQELLRCSRCHWTRYCGADCQKNDHPRHKEWCKVVQNVQWGRIDTPTSMS